MIYEVVALGDLGLELWQRLEGVLLDAPQPPVVVSRCHYLVVVLGVEGESLDGHVGRLAGLLGEVVVSDYSALERVVLLGFLTERLYPGVDEGLNVAAVKVVRNEYSQILRVA